MNKQESAELFQQGKEVWNAWANELLAERQRLEHAGHWSEDELTDGFSRETEDWRKTALIDLSELNFGSDVSFENFIFPGDAEFRGVKFAGSALFDGVKFAGNVRFSGAKFSGDALFRGTTFSGEARFDEVEFSGFAFFEEVKFFNIARFEKATFSSDAWFRKAEFSGRAWFDGAEFSDTTQFVGAEFSSVANFSLCNFGGATFFLEAVFSKAAVFEAIESKTAFSVESVKFSEVPNFIQAHFAEAPRCDQIQVPTKGFWSSTSRFFKAGRKSDLEIASRWRALKRLAVQGHDHQNEQLFFRNELLARQWHSAKPWHAVFWFSIVYQLLSDFGGSLFRPLGWWVLSSLVFAGVYLADHPDIVSGNRAAVGAVYERLAPWEASLNPMTCRNDSNDPVLAALDLSVRNALLFVGQTSRDELQKNYRCLYSKYTEPILTIPKSVIFWGHLQNVLSVVLIFLFLLSVRNHFKIK